LYIKSYSGYASEKRESERDIGEERERKREKVRERKREKREASV